MTHRHILYLILIVYIITAVIYSVVTPIFEASDELWHYPMVRYMAQNGLQLPPQDPANPAPWRQEGSQPPLYYMMAAVLTSQIDTADMEYVRRQNPHADIGIIRPDGNANMMTHRTEAESFPWKGTTLAVHVARFLSIALSVGTVLVTYQLGREIFPEKPLIALSAAGLNAFLPMFIFISASVNNDNLSNLLGNLLTLLIVRLLKAEEQPHWRTYFILGIVTGAGLLAKLNIGFLIPLIGLALLVVSLRLKDWRPLIIGGAISGGLTIVIAGWWYLHNWQTYGDPTGLNMFLSMVGRRAIPANAAQLWSERHSFTQAYWGFFGGVNVAYSELVYLIFNIIGGIGLLGGAAFLLYRVFKRDWPLVRWLPTLVTIIWPLVTFISYLRWTAETPASQGRLVFGALSAISVWMVVGLVWPLPKRLQPIVISTVCTAFVLTALLTPFLVIAPVYAAPMSIPSGRPQSIFIEPEQIGAVGLLDGSIITSAARPEDYVQIELDWQIEQMMSRDWSLFVHLVTPDGVIVSQRDVYPGQGKLATSDLAAGYAWINPIAVWLPPGTSALMPINTESDEPMQLTVEVGWYHLPSGDRLRLDDGAETVTIGKVTVLPREDDLDVPNPIRVNFDNQIELVGFRLSDLSPETGDEIEVTLYWRGLRKIEADYVVFVHVIDPPPQAIYAGSDAMPAQWTAPTSTWETGVIIEDKHILTINPETPPGIYEVEIGLYLQAADGTFPRLRIVTPDGGMANDYTYLNRVRVLAAE